ncbi:transglycosylase SLT domain-containing protein [Sutcliffiella horikoshii]|uniref:Transglycosylase SLT domain-containing protein n=2 Tax=Sutcliffiella horikoshii TaxID=79883 RepID=A0AA94WQR4_9BACI|nr:transglycosylase SLT domain-containing protein [Sutcliffiella horikoshii]
MKKMKVLVTLMIFALLLPQNTNAQDNSGCTQPSSLMEIDRMLTEEARKQDVPAEIVKAIAFIESGGWVHCVGDKALISEDGGIGIMQVTDPEGEYKLDHNRLVSDIQYNIEKGIMILNDKFERFSGKGIPTLNDGNRNYIENWYFALMAYNGIVPKNSPIILNDENKKGQRNMESYQDRVLTVLEDGNPGLKLNRTLDQIKPEDLEYVKNSSGKEIVNFKKKKYTIFGPLTHTTNLFEPDDLVRVDEKVRRRSEPSTVKQTQDYFNLGVLTIGSMLKTDETPKSNEEGSYNHFGWYLASNGAMKNEWTGHVASSYLKPFGKRISGTDRYKTAAKISEEGWGNKADTVIIANGSNFPDALSGAPLAYKLNAPILLTSHKQSKLNESTKAKIKELGATKVIILGGESAVSSEVQSTLKNMNLTVKRIAGKDRYETSALIAKELGATSQAVIASGSNFPDALAIAPYAAKNGIPILLTKGGGSEPLNSIVANTIKNNKVTSTIVVGGDNVVSKKAFDALPQADRIAGKDRYATSVAIIEELNMPTDMLYVATGKSFADALTGSVLAAKGNKAILLIGNIQNQESVETANLIAKHNIDTFYVLGGDSAVNNDVLSRLILK